MLPCILTTFLKCKRLLAFPFIPSSFSKLVFRFFFFAETQKEKANIKRFGTGAASCRGGVVGCRPMGSRASCLRFATAWQARRYVTVFRIPCASTPPMLPCILTTFLKCTRLLAFPFIPSSFSKLMSRFFFFAETQKEKANIKSFGKG